MAYSKTYGRLWWNCFSKYSRFHEFVGSQSLVRKYFKRSLPAGKMDNRGRKCALIASFQIIKNDVA